MIHTFTIKYQINANKYWEFKNSAHTKSYKTSEYKLQNNLLEDMGLTLYACKYNVPNRPDYFCYEMFVNPTKVLCRQKVVDIYKPELFEDFLNQFNYIIKSYDVELPPLEEWIAKRIDYTKDFETEHVKLYVKLFQKAYLKKYRFAKDKNNNIVRYRQGSLHCRMKNHGINFYDKLDEMQNQIIENKRFYTAEELEQARNILRIEVQCDKTKLIGLKNKYGLQGRNIIPFLCRADISNDVIKHYAKTLFGTADYYKKPSAIQRIQKSKFTVKTKNLMIQLLEDVSQQYSSLDKIADEYNDFRSLLNKFEEIGVNPVTINKNQKNVSTKIPSLYHLLESKGQS